MQEQCRKLWACTRSEQQDVVRRLFIRSEHAKVVYETKPSLGEPAVALFSLNIRCSNIKKKNQNVVSEKSDFILFINIYQTFIQDFFFSICDFYFARASIAFQDMAINSFCSVPAHYLGSVFEGIAACRDLMLRALDGGFLDFWGFGWNGFFYNFMHFKYCIKDLTVCSHKCQKVVTLLL